MWDSELDGIFALPVALICLVLMLFLWPLALLLLLRKLASSSVQPIPSKGPLEL